MSFERYIRHADDILSDFGGLEGSGNEPIKTLSNAVDKLSDAVDALNRETNERIERVKAEILEQVKDMIALARREANKE